MGSGFFGDAEMEVLRKMIWQVADFSGVEVLTYCVMANHFHVLVRVDRDAKEISDAELLRRYQVLYPKPTRYQPASVEALEAILARGEPEASALRPPLAGAHGGYFGVYENFEATLYGAFQ